MRPSQLAGRVEIMDKEKSRREKRKEARVAKRNQRRLSWMQHQKKTSHGEKTCDHFKPLDSKKLSGECKNPSINDGEHKTPKALEQKLRSVKPCSGKKSLGRKVKTKFEEYLEMDKHRGVVSAEEDLKLERKLAKKLKVKKGKLQGIDDGINIIFDGISSVFDSVSDDELLEAGKKRKDVSENVFGKKRSKKRSVSGDSGKVQDEVMGDISMEDVDPFLGLVTEDESTSTNGQQEIVLSDLSLRKKRRRKRKEQNSLGEGNREGDVDKNREVEQAVYNSDLVEEEANGNVPIVEGNVKYVAPHLRAQCSQLRRRVRGLLNRLSESNVESITNEISTIFGSTGRSIGCQIIGEEILASCSGGPRSNEQYAAVFAAFVAGMTCLIGNDFSAKLIASLAMSFEAEHVKENGLSVRNITLLLCYLYIFGVCSSDLIFEFIFTLSKRLEELDVSTILTTLQCCGVKLRGDDPATMKEFVLSIQRRVAELKSASSIVSDGQLKINNKRMEFMLETICDIKNNKKKQKGDPSHHTRIKKWLQKLRVEDILHRGLKWSKLLDPEKKGQWWLSGNNLSATDNIEQVASKIDKEVMEAQKLLQLAAEQRMNTDARRAIFCIIMSAEDYVDAFEKILRLDLPGKQDREIMRVLVECCLQEKIFNKYYTVLACKLCSHDKNHKFTLQYCLWDHFKELESMEPVRSMNLAKFVAEMLASFSLSLAVLKSVDLSDPSQLTGKRIMHFRLLFEAIFERPDKLIWNIFSRIAAAPELEPLRNGLEFFIKQYVVISNNLFCPKFKVAKKAIANMEGIIM